MDDDKKSVRVLAAGQEYRFEPLTEGQIAAIIMAQSIDGVRLMDVAGKVLLLRGGEEQWVAILNRMATEEMDTKAFTALLRDAINGGTALPDDAE